MPTLATGLVDTETILADEKKIDMDEEFALLDPDESQFVTMLTRLPSSPATNPKINWLEDELFPRLSALAAAMTNVQTTAVVTTGQGAYFRAGDIVRNANTGEAMKVTSISGDTLTVVRGIGGVAAVASNSLMDLLIVGNAQAQGATLPVRHITKRTLGYNYSQIQRDSFGFTGTESETEHYGGSPVMREQVKKLTEHKRAIEQTLFFGARSFTSAAPNSIGTCGGAVEFISTNVFNAAGALTHALFDQYLQSALAKGSKNKVIFCAPLVARAISGFLKTSYAPTSVGDRKFGAKVDAYISGVYGWEVPIVVKRSWQDFSSSSTQYGGWAFVIDMDYIKWRPFKNRNTALLRNRQTNDADEVTHEYRTEHSLEFQQERVHGLIKGVTG